jgi:hypothetical protein
MDGDDGMDWNGVGWGEETSYFPSLTRIWVIL